MAGRPDPFAGRVAVVTGASRGIGRATALALGRAGATVILTARSAEALDEVAAAIEAAGGRAGVYPLDVADDAAVAAGFAAIEAAHGRIDLLIANAGIGCRDRIADLQMAGLRQVFDVNFFGAVACARAVLPGMTARRDGRIVFVSSIAAKRVFPRSGGYAATKWALQAIAEALRHELWGTGVKVSTVCPGPVVTGFHRTIVGSAARPPRWRPFALTADQTAAAILDTIARDRREVIVPWPYRLALPVLGTLHPRLSPIFRWLAR